MSYMVWLGSSVGQSAGTVSQRPWVRVPVWSQDFLTQSCHSLGACPRPVSYIVWLGTVAQSVRVLETEARGPGFEFWLSHKICSLKSCYTTD